MYSMIQIWSDQNCTGLEKDWKGEALWNTKNGAFWYEVVIQLLIQWENSLTWNLAENSDISEVAPAGIIMMGIRDSGRKQAIPKSGT